MHKYSLENEDGMLGMEEFHFPFRGEGSYISELVLCLLLIP